MGERRAGPPPSPSVPISKHTLSVRNPLFGLEGNGPFGVGALVLLGSTISTSLSRPVPHPPPRTSGSAFSILLFVAGWSYAAGYFLCTLRTRVAKSVHNKHNTPRTGILLLGHRALSGWGYTDFHASMNFAFWAFSEVRRIGSSLCFVVFLCAQSMRCAKMSRWTDALLAAILYYRRFA
jgi:hypothetical protein